MNHLLDRAVQCGCREKWYVLAIMKQRHERLRERYCQMFNPFSTGCLSQCKCQKQQYEAVFGLCTHVMFGREKQSGSKTTNWKQSNKQQQRNKNKLDPWTDRLKGNTERQPSFFFISITHKHKSMSKINGIYIYIYISKVHYGTKI